MQDMGGMSFGSLIEEFGGMGGMSAPPGGIGDMSGMGAYGGMGEIGGMSARAGGIGGMGAPMGGGMGAPMGGGMPSVASMPSMDGGTSANTVRVFK